MKGTDYWGLVGDLSAEFRHFQANRERVEAATGRLEQHPDDVLLWYSYAYLVHNLYNGYEAYFHRVSQFYENGLPKENWHKALLDRMVIEIAGLRPAVLALDELEVFQELRSFRHLVRHLYEGDLDPQRVRLVMPFVTRTIETFPLIHNRLMVVVRRMAETAP